MGWTPKSSSRGAVADDADQADGVDDAGEPAIRSSDTVSVVPLIVTVEMPSHGTPASLKSLGSGDWLSCVELSVRTESARVAYTNPPPETDGQVVATW